tara:strand:+ start:139 stop:672 length:534 start_codon:yes stop_codon:yes gene_type:complete
MKLKKLLLEILIPDYIEINGVKKHTKNSVGNYIADSLDKIENFYKWFGSSKMVDNTGKPLVVYHGTGGVFKSFNLSTFGTKMGAGVYFTSFKSDAEKYSERYGGGTVMAVYLKCEKLAEIENPFKTKDISMAYDSIIAARGEKGGEEIMVKSANQIKAVDNSGNFDDTENIYEIKGT